MRVEFQILIHFDSKLEPSLVPAPAGAYSSRMQTDRGSTTSQLIKTFQAPLK
jgi:hypothetical protein